MQTFDLVIKGGDVILPRRGRTTCDIAIRAGKIEAILAPGESMLAHQEVSARGLVVMPGAVDVHLHLGHGKDIARPREPADADRETAAAAKGGVTTFIPYLMATEPFEAIFDDVVAVTEQGARIDFGYHFIISTEAQLAAVARYVRDYGAPSFKIFMNNRGGEGARLGLPDIDDGFLFRLCEAAADNGGMVCPHPETIEIAWVLRDRLKASDPEGHGGLKTWNATRPHSSRPTRCSAQPMSRIRRARRFTSSIPRRRKRWRRRFAIAAPAPRCISRPARIISRTTPVGRAVTSARSIHRCAKLRTVKGSGWACATARSIRLRPIMFIAMSPPRKAVYGRPRPAAPDWKRCFLFCSAKGTTNGDCRWSELSRSSRPIRPASWVSATPRAASRPGWTVTWRLSILRPSGRCNAATWCRARVIRSM